MKSIIHTLKTVTDTLSVVWRFRRYRLYPLLSFAIMLLLTFTVMIPLLDRVVGLAHEAGPMRIFFFLVVFFLYGVLYFVTTFFNVALLTGIARRLDGDHPPFSQGISAAWQRLGPIARYTVVSAMLGLVAIVGKILTNPFFGGVVMPFIGKKLWLRWRQLSYSIPLLLAVPVIALDQPLEQQFLKRSGQLVKETWGERVKPAHSLGLLSLLIVLPVVMLFALPTLRQGSAEHNADLIWLGSSVLLVSILIYTQLSSLVNAVVALAAYRYATAGTSDLFSGDASYAEHAFVQPKNKTNEGAAPVAPVPVSANDLSN